MIFLQAEMEQAFYKQCVFHETLKSQKEKKNCPEMKLWQNESFSLQDDSMQRSVLLL